MKNKSAFSAVEALVAFLIIGFLIAIFVLFIHPQKQFIDTRNARRTSDVGTISTALNQYIIDNGHVPPGIDDTWRVLGTADSGCDIDCSKKIESPDCLDLRKYLVPQYLFEIPGDPLFRKTAISHYAVRQTINGRVEVLACGLELIP